jgi:hypothetical protein
MADLKISALTASSTPLAGTEVLPIVQSSATVKVAVSNLTAGRNVSMSGGTVTSGGVIRSYRPDNAIYTDQSMAAGSGGGYIFNNANGDGFKWQYAGTDQFLIDASSNAKVSLGNIIMGTAGKGTVFGNGAGVSFKGVLNSSTVSTTPVTCSDTASSGGGVVYISGYNASGGNRFVALIGYRDTVVTSIYTANNTGLTINFTSTSNVLQVATASGSIVCSSVSLTV